MYINFVFLDRICPILSYWWGINIHSPESTRVLTCSNISLSPWYLHRHTQETWLFPNILHSYGKSHFFILNLTCKWIIVHGCARWAGSMFGVVEITWWIMSPYVPHGEPLMVKSFSNWQSPPRWKTPGTSSRGWHRSLASLAPSVCSVASKAWCRPGEVPSDSGILRFFKNV